MSDVINRYLEARALEERSGHWSFDLSGRESWANCLALLARYCFNREDYQREDTEAMEERAQLLWIHYQNCAVSAIQANSYRDAQYYANEAVRFATGCSKEYREELTTQFIWFLANRREQDAQSMIYSLPPGSQARKQLEATLAQIRTKKR